MDRIQIRLCGEPAILRDGRAVALPASRKTRALLFLLLCSGRSWRREQLCEMFWEVPNDPRAALRWSLSKLRLALGDEAGWIAADRDHVACAAPAARIDIDEMAAALVDGADPAGLLRLAEIALEPPLLGLDLPCCEAFGAWLASRRLAADAVRARLLTRAAALPGAPRDRIPLYLRAAEEAGGAGACEAVPAPRGAQDQRVRYCTTADGVRIAYACTGAGPPLVKAANWLNHLDLDWDSPLWGRMIRALSERHQLVRYDERGNGLSQWDVARLDFEAFVSDLEVVVDGLGLERFPLIGISQGCAVSIEYAARHPERVEGLVLIGGYAAGWRITGDERLRAEREATMTLVRHGWGKDNPAYRQIFSYSFFPSGTGEELDWFNAFQRSTASAENAVRFLEAFSTIDVRHRLADVGAPTLVLHARDDQRIPVAEAAALAAAIPGASLVTLDSDSHLPLAREPAHTEMLACIRRFLAGLDGRDGGAPARAAR
ncbi:alpha/beta hydrolase [Coralloluteibacterium stylophorae]|uniref:Alpha/beta fold hydrolase n=1 Tax=Coralloluteibacterium stylophorae TaxID=1776034 RepID=A0A8J7VT71_9GAMM|nr:alpha/beta hydrolase [Coralloluteibacterium stylophorae]MBS7456947.1 alpha/beta fold hydrolase [Coralloluteibacterium stylophorae]